MAGKAIYIGKNAGSDGNTLLVDGSVTAANIHVGATSGTTGNTLQVGATGKVNSAINVNSGGRLLLTGSSTATDRIGDAATITLNSGATLTTGGLSEGSSDLGSPVGLGTLTLAGTATIDFGAGANGSTLLAMAGAVTSPGTISILNWSGTALGDGGGTGNDRLLFVNNPGFTTGQLAQFQFSNDSGAAFGPGAAQIGYNGFFELVPVPEPGSLGLLGLGVTALLLRRPSRLARLLS